jgi:hypothetical protein
MAILVPIAGRHRIPSLRAIEPSRPPFRGAERAFLGVGYLSLVANYLYEKMRGALKGDRTRVRFSAMYEDVSTGVIKRFDFDGDRESLKQAITTFDPNAFFSD